jgi:hypothetical protein
MTAGDDLSHRQMAALKTDKGRGVSARDWVRVSAARRAVIVPSP